MSVRMTNAEYGRYVKSKEPASPLVKNLICAFIFGGLICCFGEALLILLRSTGANEETVLACESVTLIFAGGLLTALHVYDKFAKTAGAGTLVPITGFANSVIAPAIDFKSEGIITGMAAKMFVIAGPVIVLGIASSAVYGLIYYLIK